MKYHIPQALIQLKVKEASAISSKEPIDGPEPAVKAIREFLAKQDRECVTALFLNAKAKPINWYMVSEGALTQTVVDIKQIIKAALLSNAYSMILFHNHSSSGEPDPSKEDNTVTVRLAAACSIMGIQFMDHLIVGYTDTYSYRKEMPYMLDGKGLDLC